MDTAGTPAQVRTAFVAMLAIAVGRTSELGSLLRTAKVATSEADAKANAGELQLHGGGGKPKPPPNKGGGCC